MRPAESALRSLAVQADFAVAEAGVGLRRASDALAAAEQRWTLMHGHCLATADAIRHLLNQPAINIAAVERLKTSLRTARAVESQCAQVLAHARTQERLAIDTLAGARHRAQALMRALRDDVQRHRAQRQVAEAAELDDRWNTQAWSQDPCA